MAVNDSEATTVGVPPRARLRAVLLLLVGVAILVALFWFAGSRRVLTVLRDMDPSLVVGASVMIVIATLLGAINSYIVAAANTGVRFSPYLRAYWLAWAFGQVIPGQIGDVIGMSFFLRKRGLTLPTAVGRLGLDKLVSLFCTLAFSAGLLLVFDAALPRLAGLLGACAAAVLFVCFLAAPRLSAFGNHITGWRGHLISGLREAHRIAAAHPGILLLDGVITLVKLMVIGIAYWIVLRGLHTGTNDLMDVSIIANSAGLIAYVPLSANGIGTVETGGIYLFGLKDVAAPVVLATYLVLRFSNLALAWLGAILILAVNAWHRRTLV